MTPEPNTGYIHPSMGRLQQLWTGQEMAMLGLHEEWRDVPLVVENTDKAQNQSGA